MGKKRKRRKKTIIEKTLSATSFVAGVGLATLYWSKGDVTMLALGAIAMAMAVVLATR